MSRLLCLRFLCLRRVWFDFAFFFFFGQSSLILQFWMGKQSGSGYFLISHAELLRVVLESKDHFQIIMEGVGMSLGNK